MAASTATGDEDDRSVGWRRRGDKAIVDESATRTAIAEVTADRTPHRHPDHRKLRRTSTGGVITCTNVPTVNAAIVLIPSAAQQVGVKTGSLVRPVGPKAPGDCNVQSTVMTTPTPNSSKARNTHLSTPRRCDLGLFPPQRVAV